MRYNKLTVLAGKLAIFLVESSDFTPDVSLVEDAVDTAVVWVNAQSNSGCTSIDEVLPIVGKHFNIDAWEIA